MSATNEQVNELAQQAQAFPPQAAEVPLRNFLSLAPTTSSPYTPKQPLAERRPSGFLSLAPAVSASYPQSPRSRHQSVSHLTRPLPLTHGPTPAEALASMSAPTSPAIELKSRRSSSISSDTSTGSVSKARLRFLKLGPVHWGEHQGEHKGDWHYLDEEAVTEIP